jgi:hypothetical protein
MAHPEFVKYFSNPEDEKGQIPIGAIAPEEFD